MDINSIFMALIVVTPFIVVVLMLLIVFTKINQNFVKTELYHQENIQRMDDMIRMLTNISNTLHGKDSNNR